MSDLHETRSPKARLLEAANLNPRQTLVVTETNGDVTTSVSFASPADALFLLYQLEKHVKKVIETVLEGLAKPQPKE